MRTHLSSLPVADLVAELVIAHAEVGLHKVYDQHAYRDERLALELGQPNSCRLLSQTLTGSVVQVAGGDGLAMAVSPNDFPAWVPAAVKKVALQLRFEED